MHARTKTLNNADVWLLCLEAAARSSTSSTATFYENSSGMRARTGGGRCPLWMRLRTVTTCNRGTNTLVHRAGTFLSSVCLRVCECAWAAASCPSSMSPPRTRGSMWINRGSGRILAEEVNAPCVPQPWEVRSPDTPSTVSVCVWDSSGSGSWMESVVLFHQRRAPAASSVHVCIGTV